MNEFSTFVTHLECSYTGEIYPADELHGLSRAGKPLLVRYDLDALSTAITKQDLVARAPSSGDIGSSCRSGIQEMLFA